MILPPLPRRQPIRGLLPTMRAKQGEGLRRHRNRAPRPLRLGRHELEAAFGPLHGLPNGQRAGVEVDIRPGEPEQFPTTKPYRQGADVQGSQAVTPQHIKAARKRAAPAALGLLAAQAPASAGAPAN
ncbi:hypothetical protein J3R08_005038 [Micromonospora sp. HB375]|nr:hypothetical protein [Micromonospora sp. HB375]